MRACVMSPGGALDMSVMPRVCPRWGRPHVYDARGVNDLPPCPGYRIHYMVIALGWVMHDRMARVSDWGVT